MSAIEPIERTDANPQGVENVRSGTISAHIFQAGTLAQQAVFGGEFIEEPTDLDAPRLDQRQYDLVLTNEKPMQALIDAVERTVKTPDEANRVLSALSRHLKSLAKADGIEVKTMGTL